LKLIQQIKDVNLYVDTCCSTGIKGLLALRSKQVIFNDLYVNSNLIYHNIAINAMLNKNFSVLNLDAAELLN